MSKMPGKLKEIEGAAFERELVDMPVFTRDLDIWNPEGIEKDEQLEKDLACILRRIDEKEGK